MQKKPFSTINNGEIRFWIHYNRTVNEALSFLSTFILSVYCFMFKGKQMRRNSKTVKRLPYCFPLNILFRNIQWFHKCRVNTHEHVPEEKQNNFKMPLNLNLRVSASARAQLSYILTCAHHMEEVTCKLLHLYKSFFRLEIDPSGWKGSVPYRLSSFATIGFLLFFVRDLS